MASILKIEKVEKLLASLRAKAAKSIKDDQVDAKVGYSANYALHVHERTDIPHKTGQAKYLETPLKTKRKELEKIIKDALKRGLTTGQAVLMAGLYLQRESQKLVPVDTGYLKNSAYTRVVRG